MTTDRRALLAGLGTLALTGCRSDPAPAAPSLLDNEDAQNAMTALIEAADMLQKAIAEFGTARPQDVVPHVRAASEEIGTAVTALRMALGYPDSN